MAASPRPKPKPSVVRLRPSKLKTLLFLTICLAFTSIGTGMLQSGEGKGWFVLGVFGLGTIVFLTQLWPTASYLELTSAGFVLCASFRRSALIRWQETSEFDVSLVGRRKLVVFGRREFEPGRPPSSNMSFMGATEALPDTYGRSAGELARLLNHWRRRALAPVPALMRD